MKKSDLFIGDIRKCINYYSKSESLYYYVFDSTDILFPFSYNRLDIIRKRLFPLSDISYKDVLFKRNAILLRIGHNQFVDLDTVGSVFDIYRAIFYYEIYDYHIDNVIMPTFPYERFSLFVDADTLKPFYPFKVKDEKISVRKLIMEKDKFNL